MPGPCPSSVWRIQSGSSAGEPEGLELGGNKDPRPHCLSTGRERKHTHTKITHTTPGRRLTLNSLPPQRMLGFVCGQPLPTLGHTARCTLLPNSHRCAESKGVTVLTMVGGHGKSSYLAKDLSSSPTALYFMLHGGRSSRCSPSKPQITATFLPQPLGRRVTGVCPHPATLCLYYSQGVFLMCFMCSPAFACRLWKCLCSSSSSAVPRLSLGLSRSQVHSGYGSYFTLVVCESFPILEQSSSDFPTPLLRQELLDSSGIHFFC